MIRSFFFIIGILGLFWLLHRLGWDVLADAFNRLGVRGFFFIISLGLLEALCDSLAFRKALLGFNSLQKVFFANQLGSLFNAFLPIESGEVIKANLLLRDNPDHAISGTIVWNLVFKLSKPTAIVLLSGVALCLTVSLRSQASLIFGLGFLSSLFYFFPQMVIRQGWLGKVSHYLHRLPWMNPLRIQSIILKIKEVEEQTRFFRKKHTHEFRMIFLYQFIARIFDALLVIVLFSFLAPTTTLAERLLVYTGQQVITYLLPLLPTRIGTTEGSGYLLFSFLALSGSLGIIFQICLRIKQLSVYLISFFIEGCHRLASR